MQLHERSALLILLALLGRAFLGARNRDPAFLRDSAHRIGKCEPLRFHDELEHVSARASSEAVIKLLRGAHRKRRRLFRMEWTQPREIQPGFFQADEFSHHADYVRLLLHAIRK